MSVEVNHGSATTRVFNTATDLRVSVGVCHERRLRRGSGVPGVWRDVGVYDVSWSSGTCGVVCAAALVHVGRLGTAEEREETVMFEQLEKILIGLVVLAVFTSLLVLASCYSVTVAASLTCVSWLLGDLLEDLRRGRRRS